MENNISCTKIFGNYARLLLSNSLRILDFLRFFKAFSVQLNVRNMEGRKTARLFCYCFPKPLILLAFRICLTSVIWKEEKFLRNEIVENVVFSIV
nr:MAG TPA: hypothetical protein [Bacteriophage sp.]